MPSSSGAVAAYTVVAAPAATDFSPIAGPAAIAGPQILLLHVSGEVGHDRSRMHRKPRTLQSQATVSSTACSTLAVLACFVIHTLSKP